MRKENYAAQSEKEMAEKQVGKAPRKNKQVVACDWLYETYGANLRFDDVARKPQIFEFKDINDTVGNWRYIGNQELCDMVIECNQCTGVNITSKEIKTVLESSR